MTFGHSEFLSNQRIALSIHKSCVALSCDAIAAVAQRCGLDLKRQQDARILKSYGSLLSRPRHDGNRRAKALTKSPDLRSVNPGLPKHYFISQDSVAMSYDIFCKL